MKTWTWFGGIVILLFLSTTVLAQDQEVSHRYVGSKKCRVCHMKQYKSWSATRMANAFELLKPGVRSEAKKKAGLDPSADYTQDPKCLQCHTTGYGKKGGFVNLKDTPKLAGVGCEMCHGPGGSYLKPEYMSLKNKNYKRADLVKVGLVNPPTKETCESLCHNAKSPFFDPKKPFNFEKRKSEGTHKHYPLRYKHE